MDRCGFADHASYILISSSLGIFFFLATLIIRYLCIYKYFNVATSSLNLVDVATDWPCKCSATVAFKLRDICWILYSWGK